MERFDFFVWLRTGPRVLTLPITFMLLAIGVPVFYILVKLFPEKK